MLSDGAFTGRFNYLQLAKGLALSQLLFVCSLQGVCAEGIRLPSFAKKKRGEKEVQGAVSKASSPGSGTPAPSNQRRKRGQLCSWLFTFSAPCVPLLGFAWDIFVCVCVILF